MRQLPFSEQETIVTRMEDEDHWTVYTCSNHMKPKLLAMAQEHDLTLRRIDEYGIEVDVPKGWLRIRPPTPRSERQREHSRAVALKMRDRSSKSLTSEAQKAKDHGLEGLGT